MVIAFQPSKYELVWPNLAEKVEANTYVEMWLWLNTIILVLMKWEVREDDILMLIQVSVSLQSCTVYSSFLQSCYTQQYFW